MQPESAARPFSELEPDPLPEARGPGECLLSYPNVNADIVIPAKELHPRERTSPPRKNVTPAKERHPRERTSPPRKRAAGIRVPVVIPAKAGIHLLPRSFLLSFHRKIDNMDSRFRGNDES